MAPIINAREDRDRKPDGDISAPVDEAGLPFGSDQDRVWLAELDALIDVAADAKTDLRARLDAVGAAARFADEIFVSGLPKPILPQPMFAEDERQRRVRLTAEVGTCMDRVGQVLHDSILPALAQKESISVMALDSLTEPQRGWLRDCFMQQVFPLLTPLAVDSGRPFPHLDSGSLTLLTVLHSREADPRYDSPVFALIQVPDVLERWLPIGENGQDPQAGRWFDAQAYGPGAYVWSESVVRAHAELLFPGMRVTGAYLFRILRPDKAPSHEGARRPPARGTALPLVRLDVEERMPPAVRQWLARHLVVPDQAMVRSHPPMAMAGLTQVAHRLALRKRGIRGWLQSAIDLLFGHI